VARNDILEGGAEVQEDCEAGELPPPGTVPADLGRLLRRYESMEFLQEVYFLDEFTERIKHLYGEDENEAFRVNVRSMARLALGLLVYEALIVEMGVE
jgi:hypothetical protein